MATINPFYLLDGDDTEDPTQLIAAKIKVEPAPKKVPAAQPVKSATLPTKPLPPAQAVREARNGGPRGGGRGNTGGRGFGRRGGREGGVSNDTVLTENSFNGNFGPPRGGGFKASEDRDSGKPFEKRGGYGGPRAVGDGRSGRRVDFDNGDAAEGGGGRPRRHFERRSGTGRGNEVKRDGSGRGNWGSPTDEIAPETEEVVNEVVKNVEPEKPSEQEQTGDATKESVEKEAEEKQPEPEEEKEMTLDEYEKVREEKRKSLLALKSEERKVQVDNEFASMQLLSGKKTEAEIFVKLGSEKEKRSKEVEKEERAKKSVSINEFLKPAEGEGYYGRGRGRGGRRGGGGGGRGGYGGGGNRWDSAEMAAPSIDETNFPSLGGK